MLRDPDSENLNGNSLLSQIKSVPQKNPGQETDSSQNFGKNQVNLEPSNLTDEISEALEEKSYNLASIEEELRSAHLKYDELKARHERQVSFLSFTGDEQNVVAADNFDARLSTARLCIDERIGHLIGSVVHDVGRLETTLEHCHSLACSSPALFALNASFFTDDEHSAPAAGSSLSDCTPCLACSPADQLGIRRGSGTASDDSFRRGSGVGGSLGAGAADGLFEELRLLSPGRLREHAEGLAISNGLLRQACHACIP